MKERIWKSKILRKYTLVVFQHLNITPPQIESKIIKPRAPVTPQIQLQKETYTLQTHFQQINTLQFYFFFLFSLFKETNLQSYA